MNLRPAPTTTVATTLLVAATTLPLRAVFGDWGWTISVVGAVIAGSLLATVIESIEPRRSVAGVCLVGAAGAVLWTLVVSLRTISWSTPGSPDLWQALVDGVFNGWGALLDEQLTLTDAQSAETFAAFLAWLGGAAAVHVAARRRTALAAFAVGAAMLSITSAAALPRGFPSVVHGGVAGGLALVALATVTRAPDQPWRAGRVGALLGIAGGAALVATLVAAATSSLDREPVDPRSSREIETVQVEVPDVLAEFGVRQAAGRSVLRIESETPPAGLRLRLQVYDEHNGERWIPATGFEALASFPPANDVPGDMVSMTIQLQDLDGPWIPVPDRLVELDLTEIRWNEEAQTMIRIDQPVEYELVGSLVSRADLEGAPTDRDTVAEQVSAVPASLPDEIRSAAQEAAGTADDAIGAIDAVTALVRTLGRDDSTAPGNSFGRLRDDLLAGEPTGAEQIASLHTLMLRAVGIPSRLVVGYVANGAEVTSQDLHIWVEASFADVGWVAIDPVPATTETSTETVEEPTVTTTTEAPDATLQARALPTELGPGEDPEESPLDDDTPFWRLSLPALLTVIALAAFIALVGVRVIRRRARHRGSNRPDVRVLGAWAELADRLRELGAPITATTTTGDVVFMAAAIDEALGTEVAEMAEMAAAALHAPQSSHPDEAEAAWVHLHAAEARITEVRGRLTVPRRFLDPRVLRYRAPRPPDHRAVKNRAD